jgi:hypothetical protein
MIIMKAIRAIVGSFLAVGVLVGTNAPAANITWNSASTITGDSDVSTSGSLFAAYNIGNTGVAPVTINGVTFAAFPIADGSSGASSGTLGVFGFNNGSGPQPIATALNLGSASAPFSSLSANYRSLLSTGAVKSPFVQILDLNIFGLTIGTSYTVQLWVNDSSLAAGSPTATREVSDFNGDFGPVDTNTTNVAGGVGTYIIGNFVADATTEFLSVHGAISSSGTDGAVLNGLQVRTVPEPTTASLFAVATLPPFLFRRTFRRMRQSRRAAGN